MSAAPVESPEEDPGVKRPNPQAALARILRRMPPEARERAERDDAREIPREETTEEARARRAIRLERAGRAWEERVPAKFRNARLDDLDADQHRDALRAWLASDSPMLVLASPLPGNGKTHAAYALGWEVHAAGQWASAWTMADLNAALRPAEEHEPDAWYTVTRCDLLIIDDLGVERTTSWTEEQLHRLLDQRGRERRRTIVTTNLTSAKVEARYDSRIADRLLDEALPLKFEGRTRRKPRAW